MNIAYQQAFEELQEKDTFKGQQWFGERQRLVEKYSWAVPREDVILYLAEFDDLLEIGAGNGYWANLVNKAGGNVRATDLDPPEDTYTEVEEAGWRDLMGEIEGAAVLMVWPPYDEGVAKNVARRKPNHILYVGEQRGGCTAEDEFFDIVEQEYGVVGRLELQSYAGIHDDFYHYVRKV